MFAFRVHACGCNSEGDKMGMFVSKGRWRARVIVSRCLALSISDLIQRVTVHCNTHCCHFTRPATHAATNNAARRRSHKQSGAGDKK